MTNNDIFRRLRYTFDLSEHQIKKMFDSVDHSVELEQITDWLRKDDDDKAISLVDKDMASFLNGFINAKRGKREGPIPKPEKRLNNNIIFRKLKIALNFKDTHILEILEAANFYMSKHELSAFFRKPSQRQFRLCKDQILRNFLMGLQIVKKGKN